MKTQVDEAGRWFYRGVWSVLARWFRVPAEPPTLPTAHGETPSSFRPAPGFLRYLKLQFWIRLLIIDGVILIALLVTAAGSPVAAGIALLPALALVVLPSVISYVALHLRYDTTWYVMTQQSLRVRRGIWTIHETTITFENVQNIKITQGPVQRFFGIANLLLETAGGGQSAEHGQAAGGQGHHGLIEGVADAERIRNLILNRLREAGTTGLGDEHDPHPSRMTTPAHASWGPAHLALLREIREAARRLAA